MPTYRCVQNYKHTDVWGCMGACMCKCEHTPSPPPHYIRCILKTGGFSSVVVVCKKFPPNDRCRHPPEA